MRAWQVSRHGEPSDVLALADVEPPVPGPDDVLVAVSAAAIGMPDVLMCRGSYAFAPPMPFTPGQEVCGVVTGVGDGAATAVGERVMGVTRFPSGCGGFAEQTLLGAANVYRVPDTMSDADAAGFSIGWSTAWVALVRRAALVAGEHLLVLGAAGGSGATAVQLGAALGARVLAVVGGADKARYCAELGAAVVIDRQVDDVVAAVRAATGGAGVEVVFDPVGGAPGEDALRCLTNEGRFLAVGFAAGRWPQIDVARLVRANTGVLGVYVGAYSHEELSRDHDALLGLLDERRIRSCVTDVAEFERLPELVGQVAAGAVIGKSVVVL
jgi:NADPH2:quinone reductase